MTSSKIGPEAERLVNVISIINDPDAYPPPSEQYARYSDEISKIMVALGTEPKAREFLLDIHILSQASSVPGVEVYYPPLKEYVKHYRKTPELLVTLYDFCSGVPPEEEGAGDWLRQAHEMEPENEYVLWQRFLSRGRPWFPEGLIYSTNILEEEAWLLDKLLKRNPSDPLALGVQSYLNKTQRPLTGLAIKEDREFWNSLNRVAPHPWKHMGLIGMLMYASDRRIIRRRFPQLSKDWFGNDS